MMSADIFDQRAQNFKESVPDDLFEQRSSLYKPKEEGLLKTAGRYAAQPLIGAAEVTPPGLIANAWNILGSGEALSELQDWENFREEELRAKFPTAPWPEKKVFDKEKYLDALEGASKFVPTPSNIASFLEEKTDLPLEARTNLQRLLRTAGSAGKLSTGNLLQKGVGGAVAAGTQAQLEASGVPESIAEMVSIGVGAGVPKPKAVFETKPSGVPVRQFEGLKKPVKVMPSQKLALKETIEKDVRDKFNELILKESRTARALEADPLFPQKIDDLFEDVSSLAKDITHEVSTIDLKESFLKNMRKRSKQMRGITPSEAERSYRKEARKLSKQIPYSNATVPQLLDQYRKNNQELKKIYEPGKSSATNEGKMNALIDYNKAIADVFEDKFPDSEFNKLFKFTNKRYSELQDINSINNFMDRVFSDKISYSNAQKFFKSPKLQRSFKRILGDNGYKQMETLMNDFIPTEKAFSLIKEAESLGFKELAKLAGKWIFNKPWGAVAILKKGGQGLRGELLKNRKFRIEWENGINNFKKGNFKEAEKNFKELEKMKNVSE